MKRARALAVVLAAGALWAAVPGGVAQAHPLGNFTVNHYDHLELAPTEARLTAVVDRAEIPTAQLLPTIAGTSTPTDAELAVAAATECTDVAAAVQLTVGGRRVDWLAEGAALTTVPGAAGLPTLRLTCELRADVDLDAATQVTLGDTYLADRVGWREMTADGDGVRLLDSPVPVASVSDELRVYPADLLASPVDVRSFTVATEPGVNTGSGASIRPGSGDPFTTAMAGLDRRLEDMIGDRALTPLVGAAAVLLALLLGVGHALLPGHGKTVMAAYLAGRRGRSRDALAVGATVTLTHTVGVLVLGLALSVSSSLAGDQVIRWAGVVSGLLVAGIGAAMLRTAVLRLRRRPDAPAAHRLPEPALAGTAAAPAQQLPDERPVHGHHHEHPGGHSHGPGGHSHGPAGHSHGPGGHSHGPRDGRGGLIGMGVAGGLVPSPSALIVLMASIGLGRTVFGVFLVLAYGLGMAGTLTAVGLSLVRLRGRLDRLAASSSGRSLAVLARVAPVLTATLVLVVGLALVLRGAVLSG